MSAHRPPTTTWSLRVMTWNVRDLLGDPFAVTRVLRASRADVVCLQEGPRWPGSRGRLAGLASRAGLFFVDGGRVSAGTALLVSLRTQVSDVRAARLPVHGWRTRPRGYVRAQVSTVRSRPLQVTCLHLGLDEDERARHVGLVLDDLPPALTDAPGSVPVVLAGDLNERPDGPSWGALGSRATDRGGDAPPTFRAAAPRLRIDAVLVDPSLEVRSYGFPDGVDEADVVAASDHRPVLAEIVLPGCRLA